MTSFNFAVSGRSIPGDATSAMGGDSGVSLSATTVANTESVVNGLFPYTPPRGIGEGNSESSLYNSLSRHVDLIPVVPSQNSQGDQQSSGNYWVVLLRPPNNGVRPPEYRPPLNITTVPPTLGPSVQLEERGQVSQRMDEVVLPALSSSDPIKPPENRPLSDFITVPPTLGTSLFVGSERAPKRVLVESRPSEQEPPVKKRKTASRNSPSLPIEPQFFGLAQALAIVLHRSIETIKCVIGWTQVKDERNPAKYWEYVRDIVLSSPDETIREKYGVQDRTIQSARRQLKIAKRVTPVYRQFISYLFDAAGIRV